MYTSFAVKLIIKSYFNALFPLPKDKKIKRQRDIETAGKGTETLRDSDREKERWRDRELK